MFKVLDEVCQPTRATKYSAMVDLYAREDVVIGAGETKIVPLGVKIDLEYIKNLKECQNILFDVREMSYGFDEIYFNRFMSKHYLELHPRSSLRAKGLIIGVGVIDLDYPDELGLIVHNPIVGCDSYIENKDGDINNDFIGANCDSYFKISKGDKIAQCTLKEHKGYLLCIESDTERTGGFGSTDKEKK